MAPQIYLDHNATTCLRPEAAAAIADAVKMIGNGSSVHAYGRKVRSAIEEARDGIAALTNADRDSVVFTSGGTEANNQAILGSGARRVLVSAIEHPAIMNVRDDAEVVPVDENGRVDLAALRELLGENAEGALVCIMLANNETGVIQPVREASEIVHGAGARLHCDAVQAPGKIKIDISALGADSLALSAHKIGGAAGAGALISADGTPASSPIMKGGGQEGYRRPGTENLLGIMAFGAAARAVVEAGADEASALMALRDDLESRLPNDVRIAGCNAERLPNTSNIVLPGIDSETQVMALDLAGIAVSAGAACSSGKVRRSAVLAAMGYDDTEASSAIRISFGWNSTSDDVDAFLAAWSKVAERRPAAA
ncbi:MAG: cysteine desulfurase family protein [Rhodospirillales bacterium]